MMNDDDDLVKLSIQYNIYQMKINAITLSKIAQKKNVTLQNRKCWSSLKTEHLKDFFFFF